VGRNTNITGEKAGRHHVVLTTVPVQRPRLVSHAVAG